MGILTFTWSKSHARVAEKGNLQLKEGVVMTARIMSVRRTAHFYHLAFWDARQTNTMTLMKGFAKWSVTYLWKEIHSHKENFALTHLRFLSTRALLKELSSDLGPSHSSPSGPHIC